MRRISAKTVGATGIRSIKLQYAAVDTDTSGLLAEVYVQRTWRENCAMAMATATRSPESVPATGALLVANAPSSALGMPQSMERLYPVTVMATAAARGPLPCATVNTVGSRHLAAGGNAHFEPNPIPVPNP